MAKALGAGANMRATVGTLLSVGWVPQSMPFVRESASKLETHVQSKVDLMQTELANPLLNLRLLPGLMLGCELVKRLP